jgi:broad specificity phosphatase PhoE
MPIFYCVRHGLTNDDLPEREKVTGWLDVPLNSQGKTNALRAGKYLRSKGITSITSSDSKRTTQTAKIISDIIHVPVVETDRFRSWNMGALQGVDINVAKPFLSFFEKNPDIKVPEGQKFMEFYNRVKSSFQAMISYCNKFPNARPLIVTHSQNLDILEWIEKDIEPGRTVEFGGGIAPGGIIEVHVEGSEIKIRKLRIS